MRRTTLLAVLALTGCTATVDRAVGKNVLISPLLAEDCRAQCDRLKMRLSAVVVTSSVGACVCEPPAEPGAAPRASAAATGGGVALAQAQAEEDRAAAAEARGEPITK